MSDKSTRSGSAGAPFASEIARSLKKFKIWTALHGCEQTEFAGLPDELMTLILDHNVFNVEGKIPSQWLEERASLTPEVQNFLRVVYKECPQLFSSDVNPKLFSRLIEGITVVKAAYEKLRRKRKNNETWSESDFAAVCGMFRVHAIKRSQLRMQCKMSLPSGKSPSTPEEKRLLRSSSVVPDCATFISPSQLTRLSSLPSSPFKLLSKLPNHSSLGHQSTPCEKLPERDGFEFMSSVWEDKCRLLEPAYRQNRMATATAARQLAAFGIRLPVFGVLWSEECVRVHVDWCSGDGDGEVPTVYSAPYPGPERANTRSGKVKRPNLSTDCADSEFDDSQEFSYASGLTRGSSSNTQFHEWSLRGPSDFLKVYLFLCNIDQWTAGPFRHAIVKRLEALGKTAEHVKNLNLGASQATCFPLYRAWRPSSEVLLPVPHQKQTPEKRLSSSSGSIVRMVESARKKLELPLVTLTLHTVEAEDDSHSFKEKKKRAKGKSKGEGKENKRKGGNRSQQDLR